MPDDESFNIEMVKNILMAMAKIRNEMKAWRDAEEETVGTQVFKIGESIRAFYLAAVYAPASFETLPLSRALLYRDTRFFFSTVKKYGFFPSPYSAQYRDARDCPSRLQGELETGQSRLRIRARTSIARQEILRLLTSRAS